MQLLFTTRPDSLFSRSILAVTREPVSHVALQMGPWVLHATGRGVHAQTAMAFWRQNEIIYKLPLWDISIDRVLKRFAEREGRPYDFMGVLYFGVHLLTRRYFRVVAPKINLWQESGMDFCVELVGHLIGRKAEDNLLTPYQLYCILSGMDTMTKEKE